MARSSDSSLPALTRNMIIIIIAGSIISLVGFGVRSTFGLFLEPMTTAHGWSRETFAIALAIQNLMWGIGVPIAGMIADRAGARPVLIVGALIYALGIWGMTFAETGTMLYLTAARGHE